MGTNYYYYEQPPCTCCKRPYERRHIGKSSAGWMFSLRIYPDDEINDLDDWFKLFSATESYIMDEYGTMISVDEMISTIKREGIKCETRLRSHREYFGHYGRGTRRGEGNWDYLNGEFS